MSREPAKRSREEGIINEFIEWLHQEQSVDYKVISRPDRPDAILRSSHGSLWMEHADILGTKKKRMSYSQLWTLLNPLIDIMDLRSMDMTDCRTHSYQYYIQIKQSFVRRSEK